MCPEWDCWTINRSPCSFPGTLLTPLHSGCTSSHPSSSVGRCPFPHTLSRCFICRLFDDGHSDDGVWGTPLYVGSAVFVTQVLPPRPSPAAAAESRVPRRAALGPPLAGRWAACPGRDADDGIAAVCTVRAAEKGLLRAVSPPVLTRSMLWQPGEAGTVAVPLGQ